MSKQALKRIRRAVGLEVNRKPLPAVAWPGLYPIYYITADCAALCPECVNAHTALIDDELRNPSTHDQWRLVGCDANYEDAHLTCAHCNKGIPCAYLSDEEWEAARNVEPEQADDDREHETDTHVDSAPGA